MNDVRSLTPRSSPTGARPRLLAAIAGLAALLPGGGAAERAGGVLEDYRLQAEPYRQWQLPGELDEISGLAVTADGRLLAVADEAAVVYELDYEAGRLVKAFALGHPTVRGDFEGIASLAGRVWLVTSDGLIYESAEGEDGERLDYAVHETGAGRLCEIEGLAGRPAEGLLLLLCKQLRRGAELEGPVLFAWAIEARAMAERQALPLPERDILQALQGDRLRPSGVAVDGRSGRLLIVAARPKALAELALDGSLVFAAGLVPDRHRQPEGIEILPDGRLLIADEGDGRRARLTVYVPAAGPGGRGR